MIRRLLARQRYREKIAVIEEDREIPYIDLLRKAWGIRPLLSSAQQEAVAILLPNGGDFIAALWGTIMAGMTAFPLNVQMTGHEILPLLKQASVNTVITSREYWRACQDLPEFDALCLNLIFMEELAGGEQREQAVADIDQNSPMLLLCTSGTAGRAKIVKLSQKNVEAAVLGYLDKLRFDEADIGDIRYALAIPFSSVYGVMILSACLLLSFPIVVSSRAFTLDAFYSAVERHRITHYEGSTSAILLMERMSARAISHDIHTLRYLGFGGSKISGATIENLHRAYPGMGFYQGYGMTEAAPLISKHPQVKLEKADSVGTAIRGLEIAVQREGEITCAPYTKGEIVVRGANVMLGYLGNEAETSRVLKNGYLYTGDIGYLDEEGYLYICGRKKNLVIVRGFNVYPEELEDCIQRSLLASDCLVYGKTDIFGNEVLCADIVPTHPKVGVEEIRAYCGAHLAEFKRPREITIRQFIPKTASGKKERHSEGSRWS